MTNWRRAAVLIVTVTTLLVPAVTEASIKTYNVGGDPARMIRAADGAMWFSDSTSVSRITASGARRSFGLPAMASASTKEILGLAAGPDGSVWVAEGSGVIGRVDPSGKVSEFPPPRLGMLAGIAVASDGQVWASDAVFGRLLRLDSAATLHEVILGNVPGQDFRSDPASPTSMVLGADGAVWFLQLAPGRVGRIAADGTLSYFSLPAGPISAPTSLAVGRDGALWVTEAGVNRIARMTLDGGVQEFAIPSSRAEPRGIALGPDGAMWFTEFGRDRLGRVDSSGKVTEYVLAPGAAPFGIVAGPDGAIWTTLSGNGGQVARVTTDTRPAGGPAARTSVRKRTKRAHRTKRGKRAGKARRHAARTRRGG